MNEEDDIPDVGTIITATLYTPRGIHKDPKVREVETRVLDEIAEKASYMILSMEELNDGKGTVAVYARPKGTPESGKYEVLRLAENEPGEDSPRNKTIEAIEQCWSYMLSEEHPSPKPEEIDE